MNGVFLKNVFIFICLIQVSISSFAKEILFEIQPGTTDLMLDWNDPRSPVIAEDGDVLIIKNLDTYSHALHTYGKPCEHSEDIKPGDSWSCVLKAPYNALEEKEPTRDHYYSELKFWIVVNPK